jgi:hypothetical protein
MIRKYFTLAEANALLPVIRKDLESLQEVKRTFEEKYMDLQDRKSEAHGVSSLGAEDPFFELECEIEFLQLEAKGLVGSIHLKGAQIGDIDTGLIDFPALVDGKEVLLCWKQDEESIRHYHGLHEGFRGRKPLE